MKEQQPQYDVGLKLVTPKQPADFSLNFKNQTERKSIDNCRPYLVPEAYDAKNIENGLQYLSNYSKPQYLISFDKSKPRDDRMYKFDKEVIRNIKMKLNNEEFTFSSYLPNGLKKAVDDSRNSLASTAVSVLKNIHRDHSRNDGNGELN